jgi:DNA-binding response OmpR family regulator
MPRLLLVDDSTTMHRIVELTFAREDVQVVAVRDGEQAMHALSSSRPDIVLADHAAAGRSGYELAAFVKSQPELSGVPVLLMGGAFEPVDEARAAQAGSDGVVVKPLEPRQLVERVRSLLQRASSGGARDYAGPMTGGTPLAVSRAEPSTGEQTLRASHDGLDDYFDQLDAALGHLGASRVAPPRESAPASLQDDVIGSSLDVPTVEALLAEMQATPDEPAPIASEGDSETEVPEAPSQSVTPIHTPDDAAPAALITASESTPDVDPLVEEVTRRVIERLTSEGIDRVVRDVVLEVAERRVREELARLRT